MNKKKLYLAIPFSGIEELSFKVANEVSSLLISTGNYYLFSPISHSYPIWKTEIIPHTYDVWLSQDEEFVRWADEIWVIDIIGHNGLELIKNSKGVTQEIQWAINQNKKVNIITYNPETKEIKYNE